MAWENIWGSKDWKRKVRPLRQSSFCSGNRSMPSYTGFGSARWPEALASSFRSWKDPCEPQTSARGHMKSFGETQGTGVCFTSLLCSLATWLLENECREGGWTLVSSSREGQREVIWKRQQLRVLRGEGARENLLPQVKRCLVSSDGDCSPLQSEPVSRGIACLAITSGEAISETQMWQPSKEPADSPLNCTSVYPARGF